MDALFAPFTGYVLLRIPYYNGYIGAEKKNSHTPAYTYIRMMVICIFDNDLNAHNRTVRPRNHVIDTCTVPVTYIK